MARPASGIEIEAKLGVDLPELVQSLIETPDPARLAGFEAAGPVVLVVIVDRYLDTAMEAGSLAAGGLRARLRQRESDHSGATVLAVKVPRSMAGAVSTRVELEAPATTDLDPEAWPDSEARAMLLAATGGAPLVEIARLRQRRLTRLVSRGETVVELSLDALEAIADDVVVAVRDELEAELQAGDPGALQELAEALTAIDGVGPPLGSKLQFALSAQRAARRPAEQARWSER
ncbi:MAG TPA: CYTH domain-containing protein [Candidatus Limnocylindria bacterium]|nr:CYTH domain-containing protein [Candidatus Limnocylindria bacterium]